MRLVPSVVAAMSLTIAAVAQSSWQRESPSSAPPARRDHAMAGDSLGQRVLLFGGVDQNGWLDDTWLWDGSNWSQLSPATVPSRRHRHAMALDTARQKTVLFGGKNVLGFLNDTFEWDGADWTPATPAASPPARCGHAMAYDAIRGRVVLFGGNNGAYLRDTWLWDGVTWTRATPAVSPPARSDHAMAFDPSRQRVLLFGGTDGNRLDDTWEWDGSSWSIPPSSARPGARFGHAMAAPTANQVVLFGGDDGSFSRDTWDYVVGGWIPRFPVTAPPGRTAHGMAAAPLARHVVLFGGWNGSLLQDTWTLAPGGYDLFGTPCGRPPPPSLFNVLPPRLGQPFAIQIDDVPLFRVGFVLTGLSNTMWGGVALPADLTPFGAPGCTLYTSGERSVGFATISSTTVQWGFNIPNDTRLLGATFFNQALVVDPLANPLGIITTNAGRGVVGTATLRAIVESFADDLKLDASTSSVPSWIGGAQPGLLGRDGLHGEFDPTHGVSQGGGVFEWTTVGQQIPSTHTLSGMTETVNDGVFRFSKFVLPAGTTVRFVGPVPARIHVRGAAQIDGTIDLTGETLAEPNGLNAAGQAGGLAGAGGGAGGKGGDKSNGSNSAAFDGVDGADVQLVPGHQYAGMAVDTGGKGSVHFPSSNAGLTANFQAFFSIQVAAGGGGGGYANAGLQGIAVETRNQLGQNIPGDLGPPAPGGIAFNVLPLPSGASVLDHFLVGGSGGGGAGSHPYKRSVLQPIWYSGGGGGGGGGAVGLRLGGGLAMSATGRVTCAGGGTQASALNNFAVPGGGGSGGSIVVQVPQPPMMAGLLDVRGGTGGTVISPNPVMSSRGGDGAPGHLRVEAPGPLPPTAQQWTGATNPPATLQNVAVLQERDDVTGSQSLWYSSGSTSAPTWVRYEVDATVNGTPTTFSDDPAVGPLAGAGQAVQLLVQGADVDPATSLPRAGTIAPWRRYAGPLGPPGQPSLQDDGATGFRFLLLFDRTVAQQVMVSRVRVVFIP